jgi:hypothetical protein
MAVRLDVLLCAWEALTQAFARVGAVVGAVDDCVTELGERGYNPRPPERNLL